MNELKKVKIRLVCGDSCLSNPAQFSENGETMFVSWKNHIYSYCVKTGKRIGEFRGTKKNFLSFEYVSKYGKEFIIASTKKGHVFVWDVPTTSLLEKIEMKRKKQKNEICYFKLVDIKLVKDQIKFSAIVVHCNKEHLIFSLYSSKYNKFSQMLSVAKGVPFYCDVGGDEEKFAAISTKNLLYLIRFKERIEMKRAAISAHSEFTAVACHPNEECVLTGDAMGKILLWQGFNEKVPTSAKYHWHSLPVKTICFSASGTSFFSGGDEGVLVKWDVENPNIHQFLPRLPASIKYLTVSKNNAHISLTTEDNAVHVLNQQLKQIQIIQQYCVGSSHKAGIIYDERSKALVMNSISGHIQFFRTHDANLLHSLDIVGQNKVTGEREYVVENADVTCIALNKNGTWMATAEERSSTDLDKELRLKFWNFNAEDQTYHLNTCIEFPHEKSITKVLFQPSNKDNTLKCVSISEDGRFKVWEMNEVKTIYRKGFAWKCIGAAYYKQLVPSDLCFSSDSSLLAVAFGHTVTTWLPDTCQLKCSLVHTNQHGRNLNYIAFGFGSQCHLIVSATKKEISVWNLLTLSMTWTVALDVGILVAHPYSSHMAVFTRNNKLFVFSPESSKPIYVNPNLFKDESNKVQHAVFIPNLNSSEMSEWYEKSQLYMLDSSNDLYCIEAYSKEERQDIVETDIKSSIFQYLVPSQQSHAINQIKPVVHLHDDVKMKQKKIRDLLDSPVHTLPPIRFVCKSILQALIEDNLK